MGAKKNLTMAGLAALLAVPAFGAVNGTHIHIPQISDNFMINAHADSSTHVSLPSSYYGTWYASRPRTAWVKNGFSGNIKVNLTPSRDYVNANNNTYHGSFTGRTHYGKNYQDWDGQVNNSQPNEFRLLSNGELRYSIDTNSWDLHRVTPSPKPKPTPNPSPKPTPNHQHHSHSPYTPSNNGGNYVPTNNGGNSNMTSNTSYDNNNSSILPQSASLNSRSTLTTGANSNDTQNNYNNDKLPQTGEINHKTNELYASIMLGFASATMAGASLELKRKHNK